MREDTRNTRPSSKIFQSNGILNRDLLNGCWQKNEKKKKNGKEKETMAVFA